MPPKISGSFASGVVERIHRATSVGRPRLSLLHPDALHLGVREAGQSAPLAATHKWPPVLSSLRNVREPTACWGRSADSPASPARMLPSSRSTLTSREQDLLVTGRSENSEALKAGPHRIVQNPVFLVASRGIGCRVLPKVTAAGCDRHLSSCRK
jgi:hypothetical protein